MFNWRNLYLKTFEYCIWRRIKLLNYGVINNMRQLIIKYELCLSLNVEKIEWSIYSRLPVSSKMTGNSFSNICSLSIFYLCFTFEYPSHLNIFRPHIYLIQRKGSAFPFCLISNAVELSWVIHFERLSNVQARGRWPTRKMSAFVFT
jgi:hypothetical protein